MAHRVEPYSTSRHASPGAEHTTLPCRRPRIPTRTRTLPPHHYAYEMPRDSPAGYMYGPPPHAYGHDSRYTPPHQLFPMQQGYMPDPLSAPPIPGHRRSMPGLAAQMAAEGPPILVVHTDDAGTKLSNSVRRRCFNCCTTETSTWRRSNLSRGKFYATNVGSLSALTRVRGPSSSRTSAARSRCPLFARAGTKAPTDPQSAYDAPHASAPPAGGASYDVHAPYLATFALPPHPNPNPNSNPTSSTPGGSNTNNQSGSVFASKHAQAQHARPL